MKPKQLTLISSCVAVIALIVLGVKQHNLNKLASQLEESRSAQWDADRELQTLKASVHIDSLLAAGQFDQAFSAHQEISGQGAEGEFADNTTRGIQLRMAVIADLLRQRDQLQQMVAQQADTVPAEIWTPATTSVASVRQLDSLQFALEKAELELSALRRRVKSNTPSEYLTFKNNKGKLVYYLGEVKNGKANGRGVGLLETGSRYEGEWKDNRRHGEGAFYWPDGEYYIGSYEFGRRSGQGTYYWPNGDKYVGHWKNDRRSGEGAFYGEGEEIVAQGTWKEDKLVEER
ncbi:MORN repeat-containing protein [Robiginitalea myxolifaciens]|nr:hypothetical protein [Robiginitalea myxolifaciens]